MTNIINLGREKTFKQEAELFERLVALVHEYDGELSVVATLGILQLVADQVKEDAQV